jgi:D-serine deaminase-like pyridoxal phosphate-dependent protein
MGDFELHAHLIGAADSRRRLNTPALVIEIEALDRNIARMAGFARAAGLKLRPHTKTHKSVDIARRQIGAGAVGLCCAKLGEAEVLADAGLTGLHITSPVVSAPGIARLIALAARVPDLSVVADNPDNVLDLARAAQHGGTRLRIIVDVDPGSHRTGVTSAGAAVALAGAIRAATSLHYAGVQFYCGPEQHIEGFAARKAAVIDRAHRLRAVIEELTSANAAPPIVTGGGTGTHRIDAALGLFTELQVGSYIFMDEQYLACELGEPGSEAYDTALFIDTRVVSANTAGMVTVDGGLKAFASDAGAPAVVAGAPAGSRFTFMGDEHGAITLPQGAPAPKLGDVITLTAPHCDPTVNLYDTYHVVEGNVLKALWPVSARGRCR